MHAAKTMAERHGKYFVKDIFYFFVSFSELQVRSAGCDTCVVDFLYAGLVFDTVIAGRSGRYKPIRLKQRSRFRGWIATLHVHSGFHRDERPA